jgi:hypothetical protein
MRRYLSAIWTSMVIAAGALFALLLAVQPPARAQQPIVIAQSVDPDDLEDLLPPVRVPRQEPQTPSVPGLGNPYGESRRVDPFDAAEEEARATSGVQRRAAAANPEHDVIICEAGCDGPPGAIVYRKKKAAGG